LNRRSLNSKGSGVGLLAVAAAVGASACSDANDYRPPGCRTNLGNAGFVVEIGGCPVLSSFAILPSDVSVGGSVMLLSTAAASLGETVAFEWTATSGVIADPSAPATTFTCTEPGIAYVTVTVWNAADPTRSCTRSNNGFVECDPVDGGPPGVPDAAPGDAAQGGG
jgi:hypothetical protein